jgi:hypothetical protein
MGMALEQELATFQRELPRLLNEGKEGRFALVHGDTVDSDWETRERALEAGYDRFGLEPFMIREITEHEQPKVFSRAAKRCH